MFCKHCGNEISETDNFCPKCGKTQGDEVSAYQVYTPVEEKIYSLEKQDTFNEEKSKQSKSILILSIVGLAISLSGAASIVGFIISCIAKSKIGSYLMVYDEPDARVRVGKGLSTGGIIAGIVYTILYIVYFILYFVFYSFYFMTEMGI